MTKDEILKRVKKFQGANREFSQELPPIIEGLVDLIDEAGPEVVNSLESSATDKALSANMGKELNVTKQDAPTVAGTAGQILQLDENGKPEWVEAAAVGATYDSAVSDTSTNAIQNKTIKKYVDDNFAQKNGYYASLTAGAAENLVGRGSVPAEIAFRTSGGDQDLGTGTAQMTKILGRTEAFNQLVQNGNFADTTGWQAAGTYSLSASDGVLTITQDSTPSSGSNILAQTAGVREPKVVGHSYLLKYDIKVTTASASYQYKVDFCGVQKTVTAQLNVWECHTEVITAATSYTTLFITAASNNDLGTGGKIEIKNLCLIDLTLEGLGLTTADQFRALHPLPYYNYNAGVLKNNAATGLETVGFNQWDEEWEVGTIDATTGVKMPNPNGIRSKNDIAVFPNTAYFYCQPANKGNPRIAFLDKNHETISVIYSGTVNAIFTTPANCHYIRFSSHTSNYGTTYNHDICINISWSGYRNGIYEPYWKREIVLGLNNLACHDEQDNAVVVNGLDGVGTEQDELIVENGWGTKINKRFAEVDLGDLMWSYDGVKFVSASTITEAKSSAPLICSKYINTSSGDKRAIITTGRYLHIYDSTYSDAATFKTAMSGVKLRYELATPITLTVDEPFAASYYVNDFGTEARLPQDTADDPQAPFCAEIQYAMNATDTIRRLPSQYISDESMTNILTALKTAGIIADFTLTYDSEHQYFTCSVTAPTTEGE